MTVSPRRKFLTSSWCSFARFCCGRRIKKYMMTKIRTNGSKVCHQSLPPNGLAWAKAGVTNISSVLCACGLTGFCPRASRRRRHSRSANEIGADYSGQPPNCNAGLPRESGRFGPSPRRSCSLAGAPVRVQRTRSHPWPNAFASPRRRHPRVQGQPWSPRHSSASRKRSTALHPPRRKRPASQRRTLFPGIRTRGGSHRSRTSIASRCRCSRASIACATCCWRTPSASRADCRPTTRCCGARGMGKSSLVKAVHAAVNAAHARRKGGNGPLKLIEIHREDIESLPDLMALMRGAPYRFIVFCDDLSFEAEDTSYKSLKAMLEGGIEGRPDNVVFYATSNRRHLMARDMMENERSTAINPGEAVEEKVSLSDRFGLWLGFHRCSQDEYLSMVEGYVAHYRIAHPREKTHPEALEWATTRGARSGRVAWQYVQDLAGRLGVKLEERGRKINER